ncbi:MAG: Uncharacterised protein [Acidimicrobiales bacterium AG-410-I20]|nr:MAG: Uncharacterised protein [Acidimicrobiales bacterium AG-410-I20]
MKNLNLLSEIKTFLDTQHVAGFSINRQPLVRRYGR